MQRLFTTFAGGLPGCGLFIQRVVTGTALVYEGLVPLLVTTKTAIVIPQATGAVLGIFILIGLWTPVAGILVACVEIWIAFLYPHDSIPAILLATLGAALAMIGPGAFSIDARLFGRKHIYG
jgi:hypothetical protein